MKNLLIILFTAKIKRISFIAVSALCSLFSQYTLSNVEVTFIESAPKDSFIIKNIGSCTLNQTTIDINLSSSQGQLIFDTTDTGAGVEVYQPFEITQGKNTLVKNNQPEVKDGDQKISLKFNALEAGEVFSFTIDVDDNLSNSIRGNTQVVGSEMEGATLIVNSSLSAQFSRNNIAVVNTSC